MVRHEFNDGRMQGCIGQNQSELMSSASLYFPFSKLVVDLHHPFHHHTGTQATLADLVVAHALAGHRQRRSLPCSPFPFLRTAPSDPRLGVRLPRPAARRPCLRACIRPIRHMRMNLCSRSRGPILPPSRVPALPLFPRSHGQPFNLLSTNPLLFSFLPNTTSLGIRWLIRNRSPIDRIFSASDLPPLRICRGNVGWPRED